VAETVSEAHALSPRLSQGRREGRIQSLGCGHIGEAAYFVWALPPNGGGTAHRHGQVHPHTTFLRTMTKRLVVQGERAWSMAPVLPASTGGTQTPHARGAHGFCHHVAYPTVADAVIKAVYNF
jgi:hypothetical protein